MNYAQLRISDISDGPGIRIGLYVSGCNFHCKNCFNPETWDHSYGTPYTLETQQFILSKLDSPFYDGLSLLGGDPLWQSQKDIETYLIPLVNEAHKLNKNVWIWSGFTWEFLFDPKYPIESVKEYEYNQYRKQLISQCDVWVDGPYIDDLRNLKLQYCGSSNQRVIDVQKSLQNTSIGTPVLYQSNK